VASSPPAAAIGTGAPFFARRKSGLCSLANRLAEHRSIIASGFARNPPSRPERAAANSMLLMKTRTATPVAPLILALTFFALTACTREERTDAGAAVRETAADARDAMSNAWQDVKSYSFDKRDQFAANAKALSSKMDAQLSELRADYSDAKASASRKSAMAELKSSEADYKEKVAALGNATADTWDSAKQNVIAAWDRLQASYYKARAD
jgi:hypothetical protein